MTRLAEFRSFLESTNRRAHWSDGQLAYALEVAATFAEDASGHEHKGKGKGGGQFTGSGGSTAMSKSSKSELPKTVRELFGSTYPDDNLARAIRDVIASEDPDSSKLSVEQIDDEYELSSWKDEILDKANYYRVVDSPDFKEWFGKSHVTEDGKPLVVYHASSKEITEFSLAAQGTEWGKNRSQDPFSPNGFWFAKDKKATSAYGNVITSSFLKIENPVYLSVSDMMEWDDSSGGVKYKISSKDVKRMIKQGHDGVIFRPATQKEDDDLGLGGEWDDTQYVVFHHDNIRNLPKRNEGPDAESAADIASMAEIDAFAEHDVSDEKRDESGKWTAGTGGAHGDTEPSEPIKHAAGKVQGLLDKINSGEVSTRHIDELVDDLKGSLSKDQWRELLPHVRIHGKLSKSAAVRKLKEVLHSQLEMHVKAQAMRVNTFAEDAAGDNS